MIDLILLCLGTAALSCFLDMCMEEGMIFHWYYKIIERLPEISFKPLGGCVECFGTWIYIIISGIIKHKCGITPEYIGFYLVGLGINYIFIKAFQKYVA